MFEKASRLKLRFNYKGLCTVEDLWDLSVQELDKVYKDLNAKVKAFEGESLLATKSKEDTEVTLQIEIIKYIVEVKLKEAEEKKQVREKLEQKRKIKEIIANKQDNALQEKSIEELQKMLED